jgi:hypothetical protein
MVAESSCLRVFVDNGPVSSLQSGLELVANSGGAAPSDRDHEFVGKLPEYGVN